jgi:hypothetical protein
MGARQHASEQTSAIAASGAAQAPSALRRQAVEAASDDPGVLAHAAFALAFLGEDIGAQIDLVDRPSHLIRASSVTRASSGRC